MSHFSIIDSEQRALILNPQLSYIANAPAGSGKTELIIQRFLVLLTRVTDPEDILALTFTKKAANEMRRRVIMALQQAANNYSPSNPHQQTTLALAKQVLNRDQQLQWQLLLSVNRLSIQTIDAFCADIVKKSPLSVGSLAFLTITDKPMGCYCEAVNQLFYQYDELNCETSLKIVLRHLNNDAEKLKTLLIDLFSKRDQWQAPLAPPYRLIQSQLERQLLQVIAETLTDLTKRFPAHLIAELLAIARFAADQLLLAKQSSPITACAQLTPQRLDRDSDRFVNAEINEATCQTLKKIWLGLSHLLLTKAGKWRQVLNKNIGFPATGSLAERTESVQYKKRLYQLLTTLRDHESLRQALCVIHQLPEPHYAAEQWNLLAALLQLLTVGVTQLEKIFKQCNQVDYIGKMQAALAALKTQPILTKPLCHLLIDEFQDTSTTQYRLLETIVQHWHGEKTLFIVGDPMQSIYRFRAAEVSLFMRLWEEQRMGPVPLIRVQLSVNFRSSATIVNWINRQFQTISPKTNHLTSGAVAYTQSISSGIDTASPLENQRIERPSLAADTSEAQITGKEAILSQGVQACGFHCNHPLAQATQIAALIQQLKQAFPQDKLAILVRSRSQLSQIIPALKKANLSFQATAIDSLATKPIIQDLLALSCALLHPANKVAWLAILRAPWCGLTLADLLILTEQTTEPLLARLRQPVVLAKLSAEGIKRIARCLPILETSLALRERHSICQLVEQTWCALGGPACCELTQETQNIRAFFTLLQAWDQDSLTHDTNELVSHLQTLFATTTTHDNTLQIMTIHAAKGLEFDTVILPYLEQSPLADDKPLLAWITVPLSQGEALLLAPLSVESNPLYAYICTQLQNKSAHEIDRLLYVAVTRAKKRLFLYFNRPSDHASVPTNTFLSRLWPGIEKQTLFIEQAYPVIADTTQGDNYPVDSSIQTSARRRLIATWQHPNHPHHHFNLHHPISRPEPILKQWEACIATAMGRVTHALLKQLADTNQCTWIVATSAQKMRYLQHQLSRAGLVGEALLPATQLVYRAIATTLSDPQGQWILSPHLAAHSEFTLTAVIDNQPKQLVIDRTFIDEAGTRWIIDYKITTPKENDPVDHFLRLEKERHYQQMQQYAQAMRKFDPNHLLHLGLYFPLIPTWIAWESVLP